MQLDLELELKVLQEELQKAKSENAILKEVIIDNGLESEVPDIDCVSIEEQVCRNGINHIAKAVELGDFGKDEVASFNTLYNVLRSIRGKAGAGNTKLKSKEVKSLLNVIGGGKK